MMPRFRALFSREIMVVVEVQAPNPEQAKSMILAGEAEYMGDEIHQEPEVFNVLPIYDENLHDLDIGYSAGDDIGGTSEDGTQDIHPAKITANKKGEI